MTVKQLYEYIASLIPAQLCAQWDNDGIACCVEESKPVRRVLIALDATERVVNRAVEGGFDVLLTHHPLLFRGVKELSATKAVPRKLIRLVCGNVAAISFHTRLDAVHGGVNDILAQTLGLTEVKPFGPEGEQMGRIGQLPAPVSASEYAKTVCERLGVCAVLLAGERAVRRVAVLGGEGGDFVQAAIDAGADLFVAGRIGYHRMLDGAEEGIALIEAGHFATEVAVCHHLASLVKRADESIEIEIDTQPTVCAVHVKGDNV